MLKKYYAKSHVCLSVLLKSGESKHVSFQDQTGSGSIFYTSDVELQEALRKHRKYGKLFKEDTTFQEQPVEKVREEAKEAKMERLEFTCNDDAKDYLVDRFEVSRTKLMTRAAIEDFGKRHNIEIVWAD